MQAGLEKGSSNSWGSQVQPCVLIPQNLWAALLRGGKTGVEHLGFPKVLSEALQGAGGLQMEAPVEYSVRQPLWSKKDFGAKLEGFPRQVINSTLYIQAPARTFQGVKPPQASP